jgi:hypothetical protein
MILDFHGAADLAIGGQQAVMATVERTERLPARTVVAQHGGSEMGRVTRSDRIGRYVFGIL